MAKCADKYFQINPWYIVEEGFNPDYAEVAESVFSLANGYMGSRGNFEEGYSGDTLIGNYFNGIYETKKQEGPHYRGISNITDFMVNAADWFYVRMIVGEEKLDLASSKIRKFKRILNLHNGVLTREFVWELADGREILCTFERFLSMQRNRIGAQRIRFKAIKGDVDLRMTVGIDYTNPHYMTKQNFWKCSGKRNDGRYMGLLGTTIHTGQRVYTSCEIMGDYQSSIPVDTGEKQVMTQLDYHLEQGKEKQFVRIADNKVYKNPDEQLSKNDVNFDGYQYEELKQENEKWWEEVWKHSDIRIDGDEENQQGIRFCIFQMYQTYHSGVTGNIGAKGLTGEAYNGNAFWDSETYCLPFYIFNDLDAAEALLKFRYDTLPEAKKRATELDCNGAFYPIATISGRECCNLWQHASLQLQASTAVAYGIWFYQKIINNTEFLYEYGLEILVEVSRMLASRGAFSADGKTYGYYCVMGPDEFQMMVNHNCYTNLMAKFTFDYTRDTIRRLLEDDRVRANKILTRTGVNEQEYMMWGKMSDCMRILYDDETKMFEQHEGFFELPHVDVDTIPVEDFPLYSHWSYDRIYRNDMIKQPDVLMFFLLFNSSFTEEQLLKNYEYYESRCIHESSLSPSVHSILANQLHKYEEAYEFFGFATRMDLDNYNRNTKEGLHTTSIAAAWMNIVYGFGGLRSDGAMLSLTPTVPKQWKGYSFRIGYQKDVILVEAEKDAVKISTLKGSKITIKVYGDTITLGQNQACITIPDTWRT